MRFFPILLLLLGLAGCLEREIYTEISDPSRIGHPPVSVRLVDPTGNVRTTFPLDPNATTLVEVYRHCARCSNPQARSLGSDFDGFVRVSVIENNATLARAQADYKGEPSPAMIQHLYDTLIQKLHWSTL